MEMVLTALLMIWGNITGGHPDATLAQLVQASFDATKPVTQPDGPTTPPDHTGDDANTPPDKDTRTPEQKELDALKPADKQDPEPEAPKVKGIYVTAWTTEVSRFNTLLKLIDDTDLNAMVIDVKDDSGNITFKVDNPDLAWASQNIIPDVHQLMATLNEHDIYPIARIVTFKDTVLAKKHPEWSFKNSDGSLWKYGLSKVKDSYTNPYMKEVWDYNIDVAKEAVKAGFKEIQFDYVRFAEGFAGDEDQLTYTKDDRSRTNAVADFVKYARKQLNPLGVRVSVDIFGFTTQVKEASGIGQDFNKISLNVDVISPMIYPSHYGNDWYGHKVPDAHPYDTIAGAVKDAAEKFKEIPKLKPVLRPWIQDFTATWVPGHISYGTKEINEQIKALNDNGIDEFMVWDANNRFDGLSAANMGK